MPARAGGAAASAAAIIRRGYVSRTTKGKGKVWRKRAAKAGGARGITSSIRGDFNRFLAADPFPPYCYKKLTYTGLVKPLTIAGQFYAGISFKWKLNALCDPYSTTGAAASTANHAPYGFTSMCSANGPYLRYKVKGVTIEITGRDPNQDTGVHIIAAVFGVSDSSSTTDSAYYDTLVQRPNTAMKFLTGTGSQQVHIKQYFPMNKLFEMTKSQYKNDVTTTTAGWNGAPQSIVRLEVNAVDPRGAGAATDMLADIKIHYHVQFYQRFTQANDNPANV